MKLKSQYRLCFVVVFFPWRQTNPLEKSSKEKKKVLSVHLMDFMLGFYPQEVNVLANHDMPKPAILNTVCFLLLFLTGFVCFSVHVFL